MEQANKLTFEIWATQLMRTGPGVLAVPCAGAVSACRPADRGPTGQSSRAQGEEAPLIWVHSMTTMDSGAHLRWLCPGPRSTLSAQTLSPRQRLSAVNNAPISPPCRHCLSSPPLALLQTWHLTHTKATAGRGCTVAYTPQHATQIN